MLHFNTYTSRQISRAVLAEGGHWWLVSSGIDPMTPKIFVGLLTKECQNQVKPHSTLEIKTVPRARAFMALRVPAACRLPPCLRSAEGMAQAFTLDLELSSCH